MKDLCNFYLAFLRTLYLLHQNHHWLISGQNFYGNHLLFQRIYESAQENADLAAEKFIGVFGKEYIDPKLQTKMISKLQAKYCVDGTDLIQISLQAEKAFLKLSDLLYTKLDEAKQLSLGIDDLIMSISSTREEAVYLLSQAKNN